MVFAEITIFSASPHTTKGLSFSESPFLCLFSFQLFLVVLQLIQSVISAFLLQKLPMGALLHNLTVGKEEDVIRMEYGVKLFRPSPKTTVIDKKGA